MKEKIEIFDASFMRQYKDKLRLIEYWARVTNYPMGWHYWLDFIWVLNNIESIKLPKGSWIMDAGAGNGVLQFILASLGYNIISLDFTERKVPTVARRIFNIEERKCAITNPDHPYREFVHSSRKGHASARAIARHIVYNVIPQHANPNMWREALRSLLGKDRYGEIVYAQGDFTNLEGFEDGSVDCVVSVSALEHANHEDIRKAVRQFARVLKDGGHMFLTVSAAKEKDWYFKPCRGWCFCEETIKDIFNLENCDSNFSDYEELFSKLKGSEEVKRRVSRYYRGTADSGLPYGVYEPKYQPVGIIKRK